MHRRYIFCLLVLLFSIKLNAQVVADFTFTDSICGSLDIKFTNKSSNASTFFWFFSPGTSNLVNPTKTFLAYGNYDITLIAFGNASQTDTITKTIHIFPLPNSSITGTLASLCPGDIGFLNAFYNSRYSYFWSPALYLSDSTKHNPQTSALITTRYYLLVKDTVSNCSDTSSFEIKVKSCKPPKSSFKVLKPNCGSYIVKFVNESSNSFGSKWYFDDGTQILIDPSDTVIHAYTQSGIYNVSLVTIDSFGIYTDSFTYTLAIGNNVVATLNNTDSKICRGDSMMLTGNGGTKPLKWFPNLWIDDTIGSVVIVKPMKSTRYFLVAEDNGCYDTASVFISVTEYPSFTIYSDSPCIGSKARAWIQPKPKYDTCLIWHWDDLDSSVGNYSTHIYSDSGLYSLHLKYSIDGCDTIANTQVKVFPLPKAIFDQNPTDVFIAQPWIQFYNRSQNASRYRWDFGDGVYLYDTSTTHMYLDTGTFTVQLVAFNQYGCSDTANNRFTIRPELTVYIPDAITPNNIGPLENEKFRIYLNQTLPEFEFTIYNKWGERVFETNDQNFEWDGTFKGKPCLTNSYFWIMKYRVSQEKVSNEKGILYLFK